MMTDEGEPMIADEPSYGRRSKQRRLLVVTIVALALGSGAAALFLSGDDDGLNLATAAVGDHGTDGNVLLTPRRERDVDALFRDTVLPGEPDAQDGIEPAAETGQRLVETIIKSGDTLARALGDAGADNLTAHNAAKALGKLTDLRRLKPGMELSLIFERADDRLSEVRLKESIERTVYIRLTDEGRFEGAEEKATFRRELNRARGTIDASLFLAAGRAGLEHQVTAELIRMFSFDVDFQRGIHPGDSFELTYERFMDDENRVAKTGRILKATLVRKNKPLTYYRFHPKGAIHPDYFDAKGQSARKTLMQTPIDGARISSGFGKRRHPIQGFVRKHKGVDFAARSGTPIMAAGDGVIEALGRNGGYGRYIRIRHNGTFKTAYAHMRAYRRGLKRGSAVKQGQIIGYVGTSGASTGPHLHYEVLKNNTQVNPRSIKLPTGIKLSGKQLAAFEGHRTKLDTTIAALPVNTPTEIAGAEPQVDD